jgi:hypothetical protein
VGKAAFGRAECDTCLCRCAKSFHKAVPDYTHACTDNFKVPKQCSAAGIAATVADMCKALRSTCSAGNVTK